MSLATALLTPILGDASPWTPRRLFQLGEAGGVYDPSDLTAEKVAWRRNLLTWSEDFTNAAWTKINSSITANAGTSWDGTATASKLVEDTANTSHRLARSFTSAVVGTPYTPSIYAKAAERSWIAVRVDNLTNSTAWFNLASGTIGTVQSAATATMVAAGNGWYRCTVTGTSNVASNSIELYVTTGDGVSSYTGDGTSGVLIDSAQFEQSPTATAYQRITDFTSDFLAAFPTHGLYQDAAGTTPVTALGQPVGLVIDSKTGGLANAGPELVNIAALPTPSIDDAGGSNGTWTAGTRTIANTVLGTLNSYPRFRFDFGLTANARYIVRGRLSGNLTAIDTIRLAGGGTSNSIGYSSATGRFFGVQASAVSYLEILMNGTLAVPQSVVIDELSIREVPGVHAIQATSASRPLLDARVNLLTRTEEFNDAAWVKSSITVSANAAIAPDGTTTADLVYPVSSGSFRSIYQTFTGVNNQQSFYAKASGISWVALIDHTGLANCAWFNIAAGTVGTVAAGYTATIEAAPNGYFRCTAVRVSGNFLGLIQITPTNGDAINTVTASGTNGVLLWGADARLATDAAYPYQRVAAATDYADVGVPRAFAFDGFDDSLYTASNMDLSGTDKVTVLAGVRKLSDAAAAVVAELTALIAANNGAFVILAPSSASGNNVRFSSKGTIAREADGLAVSPVTQVLTGLGDISGDLAQLRINGAVTGTSTGDQGTGNYSSAVLFIGRRNNASIPLNGKAYQLIVRGALTDAATLAQAERYVGARTGVFL